MRTRPTLRRSSSPSRRQAASCRSRVSTRSRASPPCSRGWTRTAAGRSRARRSISRCGRRGRRCARCSAASRSRSRSSPRCGSASPPSIEPRPAPARALSATPLQARPDERLGRRLVAALAATGAVDSVDLKGHYKGTVVDQPPDPRLYRLVAEGFPDAWIEDPALTPETDAGARAAPRPDHLGRADPLHRGHRGAPVPAADDQRQAVALRQRRGAPRPLRRLAEKEIGAYGGGQFELGVGRGQIQYLASLFHPGAPNDVAPTRYNENELRPGLPESPLEPAPAAVGFDFAA